MKLQVPHIKQTRQTSCGAAALCMVYRYFGLSAQSEDDIWNRLKEKRPNNPSEEFIKNKSLVEDAVNNGLFAVWGAVDLNNRQHILKDIRAILGLGIPIVVNQKFKDSNPVGHFRVVVGMEKDSFIINDPALDSPNKKMNYKDFISYWQKVGKEVPGGHFIIIAPQKLERRLKRVLQP